jgi:lipopolysaccharide/colanic/teichoic acid biosynthesis glycosyltransferase
MASPLNKYSISRIKHSKFIKRFFDISLSFLLIIITLPLVVVIALCIKFTSRGPMFFKQERVGVNGKSFVVYKFRSMVEDSEKTTIGEYISEENINITKVGRILRRWALDELPQAWNVLRGEMSLVGPRPTLPYQVVKYDKRQMRRLDAKPGLTGWAQVKGRNKLTWPERIEMDLWYVDNWSNWLDLKILAMTIPALLQKEFAFAEKNIEEDGIVKY